MGFPLPFNVYWLDTTVVKANGKHPILASNTAAMTLVSSTACNGLCFGQRDDGTFDGFVFRVSNPAGSNDWFSVRHGTPSLALGVSTLTGVEVATWDFCGTGGTRSWAEVGIYPANLSIASNGSLPDVANPLATVGGASAPVAPNTRDWGYPATLYDTPDVLANTTTIYHTATAGFASTINWMQKLDWQ